MKRQDFVERLLDQKMQLYNLNMEYELKQHQIRGSAEECKRLTEQGKVAEEEHRVVEELRRRLDKLHTESQERYTAAQAEDQKAREEAAANLREEMGRINETLTEVAKFEQKVINEKISLEKKFELLSNYESKGSTQFDEARKERDERMSALRASLEAQVAVRPQVMELLEKAKMKVEGSRPRFEELKEKVNEKKAYFDTLRTRLDESKKYYEEAQAMRERQQKTTESIQNDIELALSRLDKSRSDRDVQKKRVTGLEEKIDMIQRQTLQIMRATDKLLGIEEPEPEESELSPVPPEKSLDGEETKPTAEGVSSD